ncbi:MAG: HAMP domain-containing sensor histidine kinase [Rikenellaceae bacterium]
MKKYYIYTILASISIFALQVLCINALYKMSYNKHREKIETYMYQAIDKYSYDTNVLQYKDTVEYKKKFTSVNDIPQRARDSLLAIHPIPEKPTTTYNLNELKDEGVIKFFGDVHTLYSLDYLYQKGIRIDATKLHNVFNSMLDEDFDSKVCVYGSDEKLIDCSHDENSKVKYNYQSDLIPLSTNNYQHVKFDVFIPKSSFVKEALMMLILSLLVCLIPLGILIYLATTVKKRDEESRARELSINGVIHDLKTPLSTVNAMLDYLRITEADKKKIDFINNSKIAVHFLLKRVGILLSAAKEKTKGKYISINKESVYIVTLADRGKVVKSLLLNKYRNKNIDIKFIYNDNQQVNIDIMHYDTVIMNLIENSLKYSNESVEVIVSLARRDNKTFTINVKDNGLGIRKQDFKKIFNSYFRSPHKNIEGYGLGLSYVKSVAKAHKGDAYLVDSCLGKGSEFEVAFNIE